MSFPQQRLFVLCVQSPTDWLSCSNQASNQVLADRLARVVKLPGRLFVFAPQGGFRRLGKKLMGLPRARIFARHRNVEVKAYAVGHAPHDESP